VSVEASAPLEPFTHGESLEVLDQRQRLGVWIFIAGDVVTLAALLFTYLYLRGSNTAGHWRSVVGYNFAGLSAPQAQHLLDTTAPSLQVESPVSAGLNWLIVVMVLLSAMTFWYAEDRIRTTGAKISSFLTVAYAAIVLVLVAIVLAWIQVLRIPQFWAANNDSNLFVHPAYGSAMITLGGALIIHLMILVVLGLGIVTRTWRGVVSTSSWHQVRLVRFFWVWIGISTLITGAVTTLAH
jgi:heme/copper-type cytochrome/quinol oxidase subunit 3